MPLISSARICYAWAMCSSKHFTKYLLKSPPFYSYLIYKEIPCFIYSEYFSIYSHFAALKPLNRVHIFINFSLKIHYFYISEVVSKIKILQNVTNITNT
jgi:hypothetical protein